MKLILGGSGQLGSSFRRLLPDADCPPRAHLDVTDSNHLRAYIRDLSPDCIINCSGFTDVDKAEDDENQAMAVNAAAVGEMAHQADQLGIPLVTFSSDYVFDGDADRPYVESNATNPINAYGRSKVAGELLAMQNPASLIVRTSWLFSCTHANFLATILDAVTSGKRLRVVDDQFGSPTNADDLAFATMRSLEMRLSGVLHLASAPSTSWYQFAQAGIEAAGLDPHLATACATAEYPVRAERPRWSVLGSERVADNQWVRLPDWPTRLSETVAAMSRQNL